MRRRGWLYRLVFSLSQRRPSRSAVVNVSISSSFERRNDNRHLVHGCLLVLDVHEGRRKALLISLFQVAVRHVGGRTRLLQKD